MRRGQPYTGGKGYDMTKQNAARLILACAGVLTLAAGVLQGGYQDTLTKAVRICLECVGIG